MCVAVMGLGVTGRAAARYALACGADVLVSDSRERRYWSDDVEALLGRGNIGWEAGGHEFRLP